MEKENFIGVSHLNLSSISRIASEMGPQRRVIGYNDKDGNVVVTTGIPRKFNDGNPTYTGVKEYDDEEFMLRQLAGKVRHRR